MKYNEWNKLNLLEKLAFWFIISVFLALFVLPFSYTLLFLLKLTGVI